MGKILASPESWPLELNASVERCMKVVQSYGVWTIMFECMQGNEQIRLQQLSKWVYIVAVGRVQKRIDLSKWSTNFFAHDGGQVWAHVPSSGGISEVAASMGSETLGE